MDLTIKIATMNYYNLNKVIKITVNDFSPARYYQYKTEIKIFGILFRKAGYYDTIWRKFKSKEIPENHCIIGGKLFEKPEVILYFQNDYKKVFFNSLPDANKYASDMKLYSRGNFTD